MKQSHPLAILKVRMELEGSSGQGVASRARCFELNLASPCKVILVFLVLIWLPTLETVADAVVSIVLLMPVAICAEVVRFPALILPWHVGAGLGAQRAKVVEQQWIPHGSQSRRQAEVAIKSAFPALLACVIAIAIAACSSSAKGARGVRGDGWLLAQLSAAGTFLWMLGLAFGLFAALAGSLFKAAKVVRFACIAVCQDHRADALPKKAARSKAGVGRVALPRTQASPNAGVGCFAAFLGLGANPRADRGLQRDRDLASRRRS